jgi:hypothetical protein
MLQFVRHVFFTTDILVKKLRSLWRGNMAKKKAMKKLSVKKAVARKKKIGINAAYPFPKNLFVSGLYAKEYEIDEFYGHKTKEATYIDDDEVKDEEGVNEFAIYEFKKVVSLVKRGNRIYVVPIKQADRKQ